MPDQNPLETGECAFCNVSVTRDYLLHSAADFYVIADYAPVAEAHLLLIPREHHPHLAALPQGLHAEFESLKQRLGEFVLANYGCLTYWENGGFGQSVPHAHLHVLSLSFDPGLYLSEGATFSGVGGLQERHLEDGSQYFTLEQMGEARYLPPDPELYVRIIHNGQERSPYWLRSRDERRLKGGPLIAGLKQRWQQYFDSR